MDPAASKNASFLGRGWSFPPRFSAATGEVAMSEGEADIAESLRILFATARGERFLQPQFGIDLHETLFEPPTVTLRAFLEDQATLAILFHEPRIRLLKLEIASPAEADGRLEVLVDYVVRSTNSRFNLVFPFYDVDANEVREKIAGL